MRKRLVCEQFAGVSSLTGDVIELGVAWGYTTFPLADLAKGKTVYACDTFDGAPYDDSAPGGVGKGFAKVAEHLQQGVRGSCDELFTKEQVKHPNVVKVQGLIEDTLTTLDDKVFCFAWVDLDIYQATTFAYKWLEERMVVGGVIGFHDYGHPACAGVKQVVDLELDRTKFEEIKNQSQCIFFRRKG